ncbi:hypothetical protein H1C71_033055 [Ictidomys tridecemlineatus]|nr:hypothetical protein H1C71_033055 [Ictidomys tridecemlineatus]
MSVLRLSCPILKVGQHLPKSRQGLTACGPDPSASHSFQEGRGGGPAFCPQGLTPVLTQSPPCSREASRASQMGGRGPLDVVKTVRQPPRPHVCWGPGGSCAHCCGPWVQPRDEEPPGDPGPSEHCTVLQPGQG